MINNQGKHVELKFGKGDINVLSGFFINSDETITSYIGYRNQTPREIGLHNGDDVSNINSLEDMPIVMVFDKVESIDVVINALREAKQNILSPCESRKQGMCSTRDYGLNGYKDPCYNCCLDCQHAIDMDCSFVCPEVAKYYHHEDEE